MQPSIVASEGESLADSLTNYLCGFAKIKLQHLSGEYQKKNMLSSLLNPEYYITTLINVNMLNKGLEKSGINASTLLDAINLPYISLEDAVRQLGAYCCWDEGGWLKLYIDSMSSHAILSPSPNYYSEGLPITLQTEITENFSCVDGVSKVETFGSLLRDFSGMKSTFWRSRLPSDSDFQYVQRVAQTPEL
ncbi:hypothetical protein GB937_001737 [Aspergillus fischeri]|nr:hypothetical protein GB937_001737 [Aspergillus fischeri]